MNRERQEGSTVLMFRFIDLFGLTKMHDVLEQVAKERADKLRNEYEEAGKDFGLTGTTQEKRELGKVAKDFDATDWLQWELKANAVMDPSEKKAIYLQALSVYLQVISCINAIAAYRKAVEIKPDKQEAWNNMGNSYNNKKEHDNALAD